MALIHLIYSSHFGHTKKITEYLANQLNNKHEALVYNIDDYQNYSTLPDLWVFGCAVRYGNHHKKFCQFIKNNTLLLQQKPSCFFSVNLTARKANRCHCETNPYIKKFLIHTQWKPSIVEVFPGALDYAQYNYFDRFMIKMIMKLTGGPTKSNTKISYTDWLKVDLLATKINNLLTSNP